jgi:transcriptional regulator of acetoin/glycerol metabolism
VPPTRATSPVALAAQGGNVSDAARVLGLSRSALYRRPASLGIRS